MKIFLLLIALFLSVEGLQAQQRGKESPLIRQGIQLCNCFEQSLGQLHPKVQQLFIDLVFLGKDEEQTLYSFMQEVEQLPANEQARVIKDAEALEKEESFLKIEKCIDAYEDLADMIDAAKEEEAIAFFNWVDANKACTFLQRVFADEEDE
jgi:hypothetical protein